MKNRFLSVLLALALCLGSFVFPADASAAYGQTVLAGANLQIYRILKEEIANVANGAGNSSAFEIDTAGMGISYINGVLRGVDTDAIVRALCADCPYELYWFDKTAGAAFGYRGNRCDGIVTSISFQFSVSQDYAVTNAAGTTYYPYQPDTAKTGAAAAVIQNARAVVERSSGLSDYEKLAAYRDYICDQVSYSQAAVSVRNYPYGNPWQLIYVFDNDPDTNVVCEGYAKAFKYLCDLTAFSNSVDCYVVTGRASGDHMWNIVRINGQSYLADVTNSDADGTGEYGGLFLAGAPNATGNGCTINIPRHNLSNGHYIPAYSMNYTYDAETKALYDSAILTLAPSDYNPDDSAPVESGPADSAAPAAVPSFTDIIPDWCSDAVNWAVEQEITTGYEDNTFRPGAPCTHAHILTFLWRAAGRPEAGAKTPVANVSEADYFYQAVLWASDMGMIDPGTFDPGKPCTRSQAVSYICQAFAVPYQSPVDSGFSDVSAYIPYAYAVAWAVENGVTNGYGDAFRPDEVCTRGQIATFLHRAYVPEARLK